jgi:hypothetical protein
MGLDYDVSLVEDAGEASRLVGVDGLGNLDVDADLTVDQRLLTAHRWVYDRLRNGSHQLTTAALSALSNTEVLKAAVAFRFAEQLAANGLIGGGGERAADEGVRDYYGAHALTIVDAFRPEFSDDRAAPRLSREATPRMVNRTDGPLFGPNVIYTGRPVRRRS